MSRTIFNVEEKLWSRVAYPSLYKPKISLGHVLLRAMKSNPKKIAQVRISIGNVQTILFPQIEKYISRLVRIVASSWPTANSTRRQWEPLRTYKNWIMKKETFSRWLRRTIMNWLPSSLLSFPLVNHSTHSIQRLPRQKWRICWV